MILSVPEMSCGHCKATVERALAGLDAGAVVAVDLARRQVAVTTGQPAAAVIAALSAQGYDATVIVQS